MNEWLGGIRAEYFVRNSGLPILFLVGFRLFRHEVHFQVFIRPLTTPIDVKIKRYLLIFSASVSGLVPLLCL